MKTTFSLSTNAPGIIFCVCPSMTLITLLEWKKKKNPKHRNEVLKKSIVDLSIKPKMIASKFVLQ